RGGRIMHNRPAVIGRNNSMISSIRARTRLGPASAESRLSQGAVLDLPTEPKPPGPWRLVLAVTLPFWVYLALMRVATYSLATSGNPGIIVAPPHLRLLQHLVLLPMLLVFYRAALAVGWPPQGRVRAAVLHALMALVFSLAARPVLLFLVAADRDQWW